MLILGLVLAVPVLFISCTGDIDEPGSMVLLSGEVNGSDLFGNNQNVAIDATITLTFSGALNRDAFQSALHIQKDGQQIAFSATYQNSGTRAVISPELEPNTVYSLDIQGEIGLQEETLDPPIAVTFKTASGDGVITEADPCTSSGSACLRTLELSEGNTLKRMDFYSNYPIYEENARWEKLKYAMIVVHGANRNADDYYAWVGSGLRAELLEEQTILLAPKFKEDSEATDENDLFWSFTGWREGDQAINSSSISSFSVIDSLIYRLSNTEVFPVLEKIIITGHSSGGLFTHVYAASNKIDGAVPVGLNYIVANSQYFYYPNDFRYNEDTQSYFEPSDCGLFNSWPLGFQNVPSYVRSYAESQLNDQFLERPLTYLLGNGSASDPSLNTSSCGATLLGSSRYNRGVNAYEHTQYHFPENNHSRVIVEGIGHNGQAMYNSIAFWDLSKSIFN